MQRDSIEWIDRLDELFRGYGGGAADQNVAFRMAFEEAARNGITSAERILARANAISPGRIHGLTAEAVRAFIENPQAVRSSMDPLVRSVLTQAVRDEIMPNARYLFNLPEGQLARLFTERPGFMTAFHSAMDPNAAGARMAEMVESAIEGRGGKQFPIRPATPMDAARSTWESAKTRLGTVIHRIGNSRLFNLAGAAGLLYSVNEMAISAPDFPNGVDVARLRELREPSLDPLIRQLSEYNELIGQQNTWGSWEASGNEARRQQLRQQIRHTYGEWAADHQDILRRIDNPWLNMPWANENLYERLQDFIGQIGPTSLNTMPPEQLVDRFASYLVEDARRHGRTMTPEQLRASLDSLAYGLYTSNAAFPNASPQLVSSLSGPNPITYTGDHSVAAPVNYAALPPNPSTRTV